MNTIDRLYELQALYRKHMEVAQARASAWESAYDALEDVLLELDIASRPKEQAADAFAEEVCKAMQNHIQEHRDRLNGSTDADDTADAPTPSGTVALEYKFGVGDVIELRTLRYEITGITPTHYLAKCFNLPGSICSRVLVESADREATLIRRAGEGERQAPRFKAGDSIEFDGSVWTVESFDHSFYTLRFATSSVQKFLIAIVDKRASLYPPADKPRPAYKAGQVWRGVQGDLHTLTEQENGGWFWLNQHGARGWDLQPHMDAHWTFVSDAPEPPKPTVRPGQRWRTDKGYDADIVRTGVGGSYTSVLLHHTYGTDFIQSSWTLVSDAPEDKPEPLKVGDWVGYIPGVEPFYIGAGDEQRVPRGAHMTPKLPQRINAIINDHAWFSDFPAAVHVDCLRRVDPPAKKEGGQ